MGEPPPPTLKVTANLEAGWRNAMTLAITGPGRGQARLAAEVVWASVREDGILYRHVRRSLG